MKIRAVYDNIPIMVNNIKGCTITCTDYAKEYSTLDIKCDNFFVECALLRMFNKFLKDCEYLEKCLNKKHGVKDESKINSINEL